MTAPAVARRGAYLPGHRAALPGAKEILDWLVFINIQCPECGVPEWPDLVERSIP